MFCKMLISMEDLREAFASAKITICCGGCHSGIFIYFNKADQTV